MTCVVLKFGGTSVGSVDRIHDVARIVMAHKARVKNVAVVVSAMAGATNQLVSLLQSLTQGSTEASVAHDVVLSTGEQVTTGLLTLALQRLGQAAQPFQGWQIPIKTDDTFSNANITHIDTLKLEQAFAENVIPVISGFQGVSSPGDITTLGRGGSDTTAVALAGYLKASMCYIYTDVDGVFTADPRLVPDARKHDAIPVDVMHVMAQMGSKVMHDRSIEHSIQHNVPITVLNTFNNRVSGTLINGFSDPNVFDVFGLTHAQKDVILSYTSTIPCLNDVATLIKNKFSDVDPASIDLVDGLELQLTCKNNSKNIDDLDDFLARHNFERSAIFSDVTKIVVVGSGIENDISFRNQIIGLLEHHLISPLYVYAGHLRQTFMIPQDKTSQALQLLHEFITSYELEDVKEYA